MRVVVRQGFYCSNTFKYNFMVKLYEFAALREQRFDLVCAVLGSSVKMSEAVMRILAAARGWTTGAELPLER